MNIEIKPSSQLTTDEKAQLDRLFTEAFPPDENVSQWADDNWKVLVWENNEIVSHVGIVERTATVGGQPVRLGGIGGVATKTEWRRKGLAEAALRIAQDFMRDQLAVEFGQLICAEHMVHYYAKFGWKLIESPMLIDQPQGKVPLGGPIMILPVCKQEWPQGQLDLCGPPW